MALPRNSAALWIGAGAALAIALTAAAIALLPSIEIHEKNLRVGRRTVAWKDIARVDRIREKLPLIVRLTFADESELLVIYAGVGREASSLNLLRHLRRYAFQATVDGVPYREYWGETRNAGQLRSNVARHTNAAPAPVRYPLLRPEDEAEVERMFRNLKSAGRTDSNQGSHADTKADL